MDDLIIVPEQKTIRDDIHLVHGQKIKERKVEYEIPETEVSKNIQKFDSKISNKVYKENPYSFNYVAKKKVIPDVPPSKTASQMISTPEYNTVGKFLGVDTTYDWNRYYDKVYTIVEWAKIKGKARNVNEIVRFVNSKERSLPNLGAKNIDNLYLFARLFFDKK